MLPGCTRVLAVRLPKPHWGTPTRKPRPPLLLLLWLQQLLLLQLEEHADAEQLYRGLVESRVQGAVAVAAAGLALAAAAAPATAAVRLRRNTEFFFSGAAR